MKRFILTVNTPGRPAVAAYFTTEDDAETARAAFDRVIPDSFTRVVVALPPLGDWSPSVAESDLMRSAWALCKVAVIKFARTQSGEGLKEAKDWCDSNLI
jgi:hypothetical protein